MKTIRVVAAVIRDGNRVFATARGYGEYVGRWEFPGGKIETGETPKEALVREIREELDSEIEVLEYIDTIEYDYPDFHLSMECYFCRLLSGNLILKEAKEGAWLTAETLDSVKWLPADITILEKIKQMLKSAKPDTLNYYNQNAGKFVTETVNVAFNDVQDRFLSYLPKGGKILDFGCGAGRDTLYFLKKGYDVDATDGSEAMCKNAEEITGIPVKKMLFSELDAEKSYDGIWACASILHLPKAELASVLVKMVRALKQGGYIYTSFKYGNFEGYRNERYFTDFTEESFENFIKGISDIQIKESWISEDVRPGRKGEKWLNLILY